MPLCYELAWDYIQETFGDKMKELTDQVDRVHAYLTPAASVGKRRKVSAAKKVSFAPDAKMRADSNKGK